MNNPRSWDPGAVREWLGFTLDAIQPIVKEMVAMHFHPLVIKPDNAPEHCQTMPGYYFVSLQAVVELKDKEKRAEECLAELKRDVSTNLKTEMDKTEARLHEYYRKHTQANGKAFTVDDTKQATASDSDMIRAREAYERREDREEIIKSQEEWLDLRKERMLAECLTGTLEKMFHLLPGAQRLLNESLQNGM